MAYEPTNWKSGDVVTSAKLNKMEQGIAGAGPLVIGFSSFDTESGIGTLDHTWQEIYDAFASGRTVDAVYNATDGYSSYRVEACYSDDGEYSVVIANDEYKTSSPDGYPSYEIDSGGDNHGVG